MSELWLTGILAAAAIGAAAWIYRRGRRAAAEKHAREWQRARARHDEIARDTAGLSRQEMEEEAGRWSRR